MRKIILVLFAFVILAGCARDLAGEAVGTLDSGTISNPSVQYIDFSINPPRYESYNFVEQDAVIQYNTIYGENSALVKLVQYGTDFATADIATTCSFYGYSTDPLAYRGSNTIDVGGLACLRLPDYSYILLQNVDGISWRYRYQLCGNGRLDSGEQCDDGNKNYGDGCSGMCSIEISGCTDDSAYNYNPSASYDDGSCAYAYCDDGIRNGDEEGIDCGGSYCGPEYNQYCALICGDGLVEGTEQCDDGNTIDDDVCSNLCTVTASCIDNIKNQNELGVDCGGVCGNFCDVGCTFAVEGNAACPITPEFEQILQVQSVQQDNLVSIEADIIKQPANDLYEQYFIYRNAYILNAENDWIPFDFTFENAVSVDFFDNLEANQNWLDITGDGEVSAQINTQLDSSQLLAGEFGEHYTAIFVCGCVRGSDCRTQSSWKCNADHLGVFTGSWLVESSAVR